MNAEQAAERRRVKKRYGAEDRSRLMAEYGGSGQTKKAFCLRRNINLGTFHGWYKKAKKGKLKLAEVKVTVEVAPIEIGLPCGKRVGLYINDEAAAASLLRGVFSFTGGA